MVQVLPPKTNLGSQLGQSFGQGFGKSFEQQYERGQLQKALGNLRSQGQNPNASPTDILYNLIEASSYSPEIGRNLPQLYAELNKAREASAIRNVNFGGGQQQGLQPGGISSQSQPPSPQLQEAIQQNKFFPNNLGSRQSPGNLPQEATSGQIRPVLSGDELLQKAQKRQTEFARNNLNKTFDEVYNQVVNENEQNKSYNENVENERLKRIQSLEKYGNESVELLKRNIPNPSGQEEGIFRKIGEDAASQNRSPGEIQTFISNEVSKYKNALENIKKNLSAPRIQNKLEKGFLGTTTDIGKVEKDARQAIQPLLEKGLYEKSRTVLADAGFYPEERERIIFGEMPKDIRKEVNSIPKARFNEGKVNRFVGVPTERSYDLKSQIDLYENMGKLWSEGENPNVNLLQLRKEYEDKGYDWRIFKDSLNQLRENGFIKLTDDQENIYNSYLNNPPLDNLGKILHGLGFRGR